MKLDDFFLWLATANRKILDKCPASEPGRQRTLGMAVLVPMTFGFFSMLFCVGQFLNNTPVTLAVGVIWSLAVMTIDRVMLGNYRPYGPKFKLVVQFCARMLFVFFIAATISHPICLWLFRGTINDAYDESIRVKKGVALTRQEQGRKSITEEYEGKIKPLRASLDELKNRQSGAEYKMSLAKAGELPTSGPSSVLSAAQAVEDDLAKLLVKEKQDLASCEAELKQTRECLTSELNYGHNKCTPDGEVKKQPGKFFKPAQQADPSVCPRMATLLQQQTVLEGQQSEHIKNLTELRNRQQKARDTVDAERTTAGQANERKNAEIEKKVEEFRLAATNEIGKVGTRIDGLAEGEGVALEKAKFAADKENDHLDFLQKKGPQDLMQEDTALWHVVTTGGEEGSQVTGNWRWLPGFLQFAVIFGLLMTMDSLPVIMKFLSPGPYEQELHSAEEEARLENEQRWRLLPEHVTRRVQDMLAMETRRHLETIHRQERERNELAERERIAREQREADERNRLASDGGPANPDAD